MMRAAYSVLRVPYVGLAMLAALALAVAFQTRAPIILDMASADEDIYLPRGFRQPEVTAGITHRWTDGDAEIYLSGLGSGAPLHITLNLQPFRPPSSPARSITIFLNGREARRFTPGPDLAAYDFDLSASALDLRGDLVIDLRSDAFVPSQTIGSADNRSLGLFVDHVKLEYGSGIIIPPLIVWTLLSVSVLATYGLCRAIGWSRRIGFGAGALWLVAETVGVIIARPWAAYNSPWLAGTLISLYFVALRVKSSDRVKTAPTSKFQPPNSNFQHPISNLQLLNVALKFILPVFLLWRLALVIVPLVGSSLVGVPECCPQVDPQPVTSVSQAAFTHWYRWDAIWYGSIARDGYQHFGTREASNVAFFPLFPVVNGVISRLIGLPIEVAGPLVSTLIALAACVLLYRLAYRETGEPETAERSVVYLLAFPAAYYLAIGYSEALYVLCVLAAFAWARQGRWGWCGVAAFLAGLTRLHGALLIVPLGYEYLRQRGFRLRDVRLDALGALGGPLGALAFNLYLILQFGKPEGYLSPYFEIQALFFKGIRAEAFPTFPTTTLAHYIGGLLNGAPTTEGVIVVSAMILLLILTLETWLRLPRVYGVYMLTVALFSLIGGDLISMPRFVVPMFPGFVALALIGRRPWADRAILVGSVIVQGVLALMFTHGYWIA